MSIPLSSGVHFDKTVVNIVAVGGASETKIFTAPVKQFPEVGVPSVKAIIL